ncbi:MAG: HPr family phosphocarrier protein [Eubacteriales bacterium]|nr:HPr family phosphocarrier protein [Eubacteriales bacterium]
MVERVITLKTSSDYLSPTEAALINRVAENFSSLLYIRRGRRWVSARSITGLLSMELADGETVSVISSGSDEVRALNSLAEFLKQNL